MMTTYSLFGLTLTSNFRLTRRVALLSNTVPDLTLTRTLVDALPGDSIDLAPTYTSPYKLRNGQSLLYAYRQAACDLLHFPNTADFSVWPDRIVCHQWHEAHDYEVERWLVGTVLALWLERRGTPMLHASAVVVADHAVAFLASNTAGKSSLAAALMQGGQALLTDDVLPITRGDQTFLGQPGYPQMRLWPDQAQHFLGHFADLPLVHPEATKRAIAVGPEGLGMFCDRPQPLRCLYIPSRRDPAQAGTSVEITPVSPRDACIELVRYSFSTRLVTALGLQPQRLPRLAQIADEVPVRRLMYPSGMEYLPGVCATILEDVRALPPRKARL